ncbi:MAG: chemotaxis protein MotA [Chlorobi bacterium]|nr:chemotaxis protein MotA [Chlorobiota bacterium]
MLKKSGSVFGLVLGVVSIFGAFFIEGGSAKALFLIAPLIIVFGGTFATVIMGFGMTGFRKVFTLTKLAYSSESYEIEKMINGFIFIARQARTNGLLSIEKELHRLIYHFPQKMIRFILDGTNGEGLEIIANLEMKAMSDRHNSNAFIFSKMGGYAPTMGIIGTVMGLIVTLANAGGDPNQLIHSIATAFIATLWGIFSANIIWLPIADKLKQWHLEEIHMMEVALEASLEIQSGEIPSVIRSRLICMLPQKDQERIMQKG